MTTAGYVRISKDPLERRVGVKRQRADCAERAVQVDIDPATLHWIEDNDVSAWNPKIRRPGIDEMFEGIRSGRFDTVIVWDIDRLFRQMRELEELIELAESTTVTIYSAKGDLDLSTSEGRLMARMQVAVAQKASDDTSRRVRRALEERRSEGKALGPVPWGFLRDADGLDTYDPSKVEFVREAYTRAEQGESARAIARWANTTDHPPQRTDVWRGYMISNLIRARRWVDAGVVTEDEWTLANHQLDITATRTGHSRSASSPLVGYAKCGLCDSPMHTTYANGKRSYGCRSCFKVTVKAEPVDRYVVGWLADQLDDVKNRPATHDPNQAATIRQLNEDVAALAQVERRFYVDRDMEQSTFDAIRTDLTQRVDANRARLRGENRALSIWLRNGDQLRALLEQGGLEGEAGVETLAPLLAVLVAAVVIHPASRRGERFHPGRLTIQRTERRQ